VFSSKISYRYVVKEFVILPYKMTGYSEGRSFLEKTVEMTNSIFYSSFVLTAIGSGKIRFKARQGLSHGILQKLCRCRSLVYARISF